jgi:hypothetical protein
MKFHVQPYPRPERLERHPRTLAGSLINFTYNPQCSSHGAGPTFLRRTRRAPGHETGAVRNQSAYEGRKKASASAECAHRQPTVFKTMLANRRCVIPAKRFYEWREELDQKHLFARKDGQPLMFAGI